MNCKQCNLEFKDQSALIRHIKKSHPEFENYEQYVIIHYYDGVQPTCKCGCGTNMTFESHNNPRFYKDFTKNHWPHKLHTPETKEKIKKQLASSMVELYGVDNPMKLQKFIDKIAETKSKVHDNPKYNNPDKTKKTNLEKYGVEYPQQNLEIKEKSKSTNFTKFGAATYTSTDEGKIQVKKTKLKNHGDENYVNVEKGKKTKLEKYGHECEFTNPEWQKQNRKRDSKIKIKHRLNKYEFDGKFFNFLIEVDGAAYHPNSMSNMTLTQLTSAQNDFKKTNLIPHSDFELIRVDAAKLKKLKTITFEDVWLNAYEQDFSFDFYTKFMTIESLRKLGKDTLNKYWKVFYNFKRTFQPSFPDIPTTERIETVIDKIAKYDFIPVNDRTFNNNTSLTGVSYLKSKFKSYWKSSYKNKLSPVLGWNDEKTMQRLIKYRIGINDSGEVFDFSIHQLVRGLSALRLTVSFFKPILAASIYKHFIGDHDNPVVFDPCCGFGGRMLGFKGLYPHGTYIGCEPNIETFNELQELSKNFTNVQIYNCKIEDFDVSLLPENLDLTFTSIPYFDLETYSNPVEYKNFEEWQETFLDKITSLPKLVLNVPDSLRNNFSAEATEYYIKSSTAHFNKSKTTKTEFLLDLR